MEENKDVNALNEKIVNEENLVINKKTSTKSKLMIFICFITIMTLSVIGIIIAFSINRDQTKEEEKKNNDDDTSQYELDTIPPEELKKARESFGQFKFTKDSKFIDYNLYIPKNISENEIYPLIVFISDESLINNKTTTPLTMTVGGPIWATETVQKKHKCYVLVPQYNEDIITKEIKIEYINLTIDLIGEIQSNYSIDKNKIYGTGQSMGAMATLYLLSNHSYLYTAGLIVDGYWNIDELHGLVNSTFTYFAAEGDPDAFNGQNKLKEYFDLNNIIYSNMSHVNALENVTILNEEAFEMYKKGSNKNFITYAKGTVIKHGSNDQDEHKASFKYGYRIETVRDWLFNQTKSISE